MPFWTTLGRILGLAARHGWRLFALSFMVSAALDIAASRLAPDAARRWDDGLADVDAFWIWPVVGHELALSVATSILMLVELRRQWPRHARSGLPMAGRVFQAGTIGPASALQVFGIALIVAAAYAAGGTAGDLGSLIAISVILSGTLLSLFWIVVPPLVLIDDAGWRSFVRSVALLRSHGGKVVGVQAVCFSSSDWPARRSLARKPYWPAEASNCRPVTLSRDC